MDIGDQHIIYSLRILSSLEKNQWLITNRGDNNEIQIDALCNSGYYNNVILSVRGDSWVATKECLKRLFCEELPNLANKLIELDEKKYLRNLKEHLSNSFNGLENLKSSYPSHKHHLSSN